MSQYTLRSEYVGTNYDGWFKNLVSTFEETKKQYATFQSDFEAAVEEKHKALLKPKLDSCKDSMNKYLYYIQNCSTDRPVLPNVVHLNEK